MATRGYNSYRGRVSTGRIVLIVVLVLVLLGAIGYLAVQNYLVYDEAGQVHLLSLIHISEPTRPY